MNDRVFIDSNVLIYAYSEEEIKRGKALGIIKMNLSSQYKLSMNSLMWLRKNLTRRMMKY